MTFVGLLASVTLAGQARVDRQAAAMDYGPTLGATVGVNAENVVPKGIVVKLDKAGTTNVLFDTELLRLAAGWSGGWLDLRGRVYSGNSDDFPLVMGDVHVRTRVTPGWTSGDRKDDPRRDGPLPREWARFRGHHLHGDRVVLAYTVGACEVLEMPSAVTTAGGGVAIARTIAMKPNPAAVSVLVAELSEGKGTIEEGLPAARNAAGGGVVAGVVGMPPGAQWEIAGARIYLRLPATDQPVRFKLVAGKTAAAVKGMLGSTVEDLEPLTKGGPARWTSTVTSRGVVETLEEHAYAADTILLPDDNAYKSWMRPTGLDFFAGGKSAAICTWSGDVWVVSGLDHPKLLNLTWRRFATGLHQPMGLKIVNGKVHVMGRDQLTRLHDLNADGEADFYECVNNDVILTTNFHEFNYDLQADHEGNFYFSKGSALFTGSQRMTPHHGAICRVSKDGATFEVLANGFRAANGVGVSPTGDVWCTDNQGDWVPSCTIVKVKRGGYYGFVGKDQSPRPAEAPAVWVPFAVDKSSAGLTWVEGGKWGPLEGHMLMCSYDVSLFKVYHETVDGVTQGGVARFPLFFSSGLMRGRFSPLDGQLYVVGMRGWASRASRDGAFYRIRHTGKPLHLPLAVKTIRGGMEVTFDVGIDRESLRDPGNVGVEWWNVVRSPTYGSPEMSVSDPTRRGREAVEVKSLQLRPDGKTIFVEMPGLRPVTNLTMRLRIKDAQGAPIKQELHYTIHKVPGQQE